MNLRTVTFGIPLNMLNDIDLLEQKISIFADAIRNLCAEINVSIRTFRINLTPINHAEPVNVHRVFGYLDQVTRLCEKLNIRWFNVPIDLVKSASDTDILLNNAYEIIKRYPNAFINIIVASNNNLNIDSIQSVGKFIKEVSRIDTSGYNNFRVGVSCNPGADTPFFPFTYSSENLGFSVGLEMPKEFISIINSIEDKDLNNIRQRLIEKISPEIKQLEDIFLQVSKDVDVEYKGIDMSLAPYPEQGGSVAEIIELLGIEQQGSNGTLFVTSYLTDILKTIGEKAGVKTVGFSGVMYSLLEDEFMGKRNNNSIYSIDSLISYSAVCGCGLDMVPLPGDVYEEEISSIILDVAALSTRLVKPLGIRVLPIPMKQENEFTEFNMDFLFNTRIKKVKNIIFNNKAKAFYYLKK